MKLPTVHFSVQYPVTLSILRLRPYQINYDLKFYVKFAGRYTKIQCDLQTSSFFFLGGGA